MCVRERERTKERERDRERKREIEREREMQRFVTLLYICRMRKDLVADELVDGGTHAPKLFLLFPLFEPPVFLPAVKILGCEKTTRLYLQGFKRLLYNEEAPGRG